MWNDAKDYEVGTCPLLVLMAEHDPRDVANSRRQRAIQQYRPVPQGKEAGQGCPRALPCCDHLIAQHSGCGQAGASHCSHSARHDPPARSAARICDGLNSGSTSSIHPARGCCYAIFCGPDVSRLVQVQGDARSACSGSGGDC